MIDMIRKLILISLLFFSTSVFIFSKVQSENFLEGATVTSMTIVGDNLWVATYGQGIYKYSYRENSWYNYSTENKNLENNFFYSIAANKDYVWAGATDGLYILDRRRNQWRKRKFSLGGEMGNWIRSLCYDAQQNVLWIGRFENITMLEVGKQRYQDYSLMINNDSKSNNIKSIRLDGDSLVWFGSESGVHIFNKRMKLENKDAWTYISNKDGGFNDEGESVSISDIIFDPENVWFGTDEFITIENPKFNIGGIYKFNRKHNWERLSEREGLPADGIYCMVRVGNEIFAGIYSFQKKEKKDYGKGLVMINRINDDITPVDLNGINIQSSKITSLYFDGTSLWIGTDNGLTKVLIANPMAHWGGRKIEIQQEQPRREKSG
ncbi:MAG: hypothetical protein ACYCVH_07505 [Ignavibacteriaceae bacterium]